MPIVEIVATQRLTEIEVTPIKKTGVIIGYDDPKKIWVRSSDDLTQSDIMYVKIYAEASDRAKPSFTSFCEAIALYLQYSFSVSVEVMVCTINESYWFPTEDGVKVYGSE